MTTEALLCSNRLQRKWERRKEKDKQQLREEWLDWSVALFQKVTAEMREKKKTKNSAEQTVLTEALLCSDRLQHAGVWRAQQLQTAWRGGQSAWLLQRGGGASPASALPLLFPAQGLHLRPLHHVRCRHSRHQRHCASLRRTEVASHFLMSHPPPHQVSQSHLPWTK